MSEGDTRARLSTQTKSRLLEIVRKSLSYAIVPAFAALVEYVWGWSSLFETWSSLSLQAGMGAIGLILASYAIRAFRLFDYYRASVGGQFLLCLRVVLLNNVLNAMLPMRGGEVSFPILLRRYFNIAISDSVAALLWFRLLDLHTIVLMAAVALAQIWSPSNLLTALIVLFVLPVPLGLHLVQGMITRRAPTAPQGPIKRRLWKFATSGPKSTVVLLRAWSLSLINWVLKLTVLAWILQHFHVLSFPEAISGVIGGELSSVLPIHTVGGLGSYEAGMVAAMLPLGVNVEAVLPACVGMHLFLLGVGLIGGMIGLAIPLDPAGRVDQDRPEAAASPVR